MNWLIAALVGLLSGTLGLFSVGFLGGACVRWYRISSFEGGSGYFMILLALVGAAAGFIIGLATALAFNWGGGAAGFFKALGSACAAVLLLSGIATLMCRALADIPPEIDGRELTLELEWKLPAGETNLPKADGDETFVELSSVVDHTQRDSRRGEVKLSQARNVDGRWVIPGSVFLFTRRGHRAVSLNVEGKTRDGFILPVPARPGRESLEWSDWFPRPRRGDPPWPETKSSVRFRVQPILPPPPEPDQETVESEQFAALKPDSPLSDWLEFVRFNVSADRFESVIRHIAGRPEEHARLIASEDDGIRERALSAVTQFNEIRPEIAEAVRAEGRIIANGIREFNKMSAEAPDFYDVQIRLRSRFSHWHHAWWVVHQRSGVDGRPPVQEILELAEVRAKDTSMEEIVANAKAHLKGIKTPEAPVP